MAYSQDYRKMILAKLESGTAYRELAKEFKISTRTIQNWKKQPERKIVTTRKGKIDIELLRQDGVIHKHHESKGASKVSGTHDDMCKFFQVLCG